MRESRERKVPATCRSFPKKLGSGVNPKSGASLPFECVFQSVALVTGDFGDNSSGCTPPSTMFWQENIWRKTLWLAMPLGANTTFYSSISHTSRWVAVKDYVCVLTVQPVGVSGWNRWFTMVPFLSKGSAFDPSLGHHLGHLGFNGSGEGILMVATQQFSRYNHTIHQNRSCSLKKGVSVCPVNISDGCDSWMPHPPGNLLWNTE